MKSFPNPFRPGAGQKPPYLAGRSTEQDEFLRLLQQEPVLQNLVLTGLRGVGKTVLLESLQPVALAEQWLWCGTDLSEAAGLSEENLCIRIITDIASATASFPAVEIEETTIGFKKQRRKTKVTASYQYLTSVFDATPGLQADKLKAVLETVWHIVQNRVKGIVLAYDEAQILRDKANGKEFPLSLLLEVIQFVQRKEIPYLLVLTGLPTLFANLVDARTYAERMFRIMRLDRLNDVESRAAIEKPTLLKSCPVRFADASVLQIVAYSGGYPYFIQFLCKESFDAYLSQMKAGIAAPEVQLGDIVRKLDTDFYAGRWDRISQKQREVMAYIAQLPNAEEEFSLAEVVEIAGRNKKKGMSSSSLNQIINKLVEAGLVYRQRHGRYTFGIPMLADFIKRQIGAN